MPSEFQQGEGDEYKSEIERHCAEFPERTLLRIKPATEGIAKEYLGGVNKHERSTEVKEHFFEEVQRFR